MIETPINRMRTCINTAKQALEMEYLYAAKESINAAIDIYEKNIRS